MVGSRAWREPNEMMLIAAARNGDEKAMDAIIRRYEGFVRLKASSYFLAGGDSHDLIQEGLVGLFKAVRDFRPDKDTSFRSFAELCITRQIITAIKTATRLQARAAEHLRLVQPHARGPGVRGATARSATPCPGPAVDDPASCVISTEELQSLLDCLGTTLSSLESQVLTCYLEGRTYEEIGELLGCDPKTVDNALQRVKRKVQSHLNSRQVLS